MCKTAQARTDPADIINSAIDALIWHDFELPPLGTLRRLAGTAPSNINAAQWTEVCGRLSSAQQAVLETLLVVDPKTQKSPFSNLCSTPGRPSRKNLNALIDRYQWIEQLPNPTTALPSIADSKISQWANEARRLNALELREYITPRRHTLLMAVIHDARGQVLDELTQMLLRFTRKVEWKSELRLTEWYQTRRNKADALIRAFRDSLIVHGSDVDPVQKVSRVETVFAAQGGHEEALALTAMQSAVVCLGSLYALYAMNGIFTLTIPDDLAFWSRLGFLVLFSTIFAFFAQNYAAARTSPSRVAFLMGSEPVFGAIFAALLMGETLTGSGWIGAILIVLATTFVLQRNRAN